MDTIESLWLGHFGMTTIIAMITDMCESLNCKRDLVPDTTDIVESAEQLAEASEDINDTLTQIAVMVVYCESSYGVEATIEALTEAGAYPDLITEARDSTEYLNR
jgi:hypothetical protein